MSFYRGGSRQFSPRGQGNRGFGGRGNGQARRKNFAQGQYIHPSRYVNHAVAPVEETIIPVTHEFIDFGLHSELMANVTAHGYTKPTPIQDQAIKPIMEGRDLVGIANTGTGKTAAFLLPLIHKVMADRQQGVMIVVPTRELAQQISDEFMIFARGLSIGKVICVGGVNINPQIFKLRDNPHFVIGTPGRLKDLIERRALDTKMYSNVVLDEVDRMLDIGFVRDIRFLISNLPEQRSSYFFSATMNREAEAIMQSFLKNPVMVSVKTRETSEHIHQDVIKLQPGTNKIDVLHDLLKQDGFDRVIVFGRTKHGINKLEEVLSGRGLRVSAIHGNKTQGARQRALDQFKKGYVKALLATDVAARGIDIDDVTHVINYDEPNSFEDYTHRIGRTGRAGKRGVALTFVM